MKPLVARLGAGAFFAGAALLVFPVLDAGAATFTVTNTNDSGAGSLRQAITDASAAPGVDTVVIPSALGTITLSSTIQFTGADLTTVQGNGNTVSYPSNTVFNSGGTTPYTLDGLTISGDTAANALDGALTITNSTLNVGDLGANTMNGALSVSGTTVNSDSGGFNTMDGALTLTGSTINATDTGLNTSGGTVTVTGSSITASGGGNGMAVNTSSAPISITDSQVLADEVGVNTSAGTVVIVRSSILGVGSIGETGVNQGQGSITLVNSTVTGFSNNGVRGTQVTLVYASIVNNGGPEDANVDAGELTTFGSVLTSSADDCNSRSTVSNGYNFSNDATCNLTGTGDTQNGGDPGLGALADNGGPGPTFLPQTTSPLLNAIPLGSCQDDGATGITTDERSLPRPAGPGCEIGAVEVQVQQPTTSTSTTTAPSSTTSTTVATVPTVTPTFTG